MAKGKMNKLAIECSNPIPTKVEMGNQQPTNLTVKSLAAPDKKTAMLTIQLHMMALMRVGTKAVLVLPTAVLMARAAAPRFKTSAAMAAQAKRPQLTKLPPKDTDQLVQRSFQETKPSNLAATTVVEFPVNSYPDVGAINKRLTGKSAAKAILVTPGLAADMPPKLPAMAREMRPPNPT